MSPDTRVGKFVCLTDPSFIEFKNEGLFNDSEKVGEWLEQFEKVRNE